MNQEELTKNFKNLNEAYTIVKTYKGSTYFKRRIYETCIKDYPKENCIFYVKELAEEKLKQVNSGRTRNLYRLEPASNYFINIYYISTNRHTIGNKPLSIKEFKDTSFIGFGRYLTFEEAKKQILLNIQKDIEENINIAKREESLIEEKIQKVKKDLKDRVEYFKKRAEELSESMQTIEQFCISEYETKSDILVKVLYGKPTTTSK